MIHQHHVYPFVRIGEPCDFDPTLEDVPYDDDWRIEIAGTLHDTRYSSRRNALQDVEIVLFDLWPDKAFIPQRIQAAVDAGNMTLAQELVEGQERSHKRRDDLRRHSKILALHSRLFQPLDELTEEIRRRRRGIPDDPIDSGS